MFISKLRSLGRNSKPGNQVARRSSIAEALHLLKFHQSCLSRATGFLSVWANRISSMVAIWIELLAGTELGEWSERTSRLMQERDNMLISTKACRGMLGV
jgi:hypothetical protein